VQVLDSCRYSSFISYRGPESIRTLLVAAADGGPAALCATLPE
jgi:hypothetical protein